MDRLYFFAYFVVDEVIKYNSWRLIPDYLKQRISNNHHYIHERDNQVVVLGDRSQSKVSEKAVLLSSKTHDRSGSNYYPCKRIKELLGGYNAAMNMSSLRQFETSFIGQAFKAYLDSHSGRNLLGKVDLQTFYITFS